MIVKLLTEHYFEFQASKEAAQARLSQNLSKCHIVGNHMSRLIYSLHMSLSQSLIVVNQMSRLLYTFLRETSITLTKMAKNNII